MPEINGLTGGTRKAYLPETTRAALALYQRFFLLQEGRGRSVCPLGIGNDCVNKFVETFDFKN